MHPTNLVNHVCRCCGRRCRRTCWGACSTAPASPSTAGVHGRQANVTCTLQGTVLMSRMQGLTVLLTVDVTSLSYCPHACTIKQVFEVS